MQESCFEWLGDVAVTRNRPSAGSEVVADALPRARKHLLQALELLDTPGYISKKMFKQMLLRVKMELLTANRHKAGRPYQAPRAERSAEYARHAYMKSVGHQQHSVKDLSLAERAKEFIEHAERIGAIYAMAGDVSGWDTSWDERHLELAQQLTGRILNTMCTNVAPQS